MHFLKQDLDGGHYHWTSGDEHLYTGQPSRRKFDKFNGNQVLFLINFYSSLSERVSLKEGKNIERRIQDELPEDVKSEVAVFNWIRKLTMPV
ncbi:MAG TPA: hypothetical protein PLO99_03065 [Chitinophagaceae bacterium]|jgi:hypothetical protein|nr:hypothetical protein [Chitinophagaceae bacterium]